MSKIAIMIDPETGEFLGETKVYDLEDNIKMANNAEKRKSDDEFKMFVDETYGSFYFLFYKLLNENIDKQYIIRFLYLCTFMDYENNLLFGNAQEDGALMLDKDLQEVLRLSKRETLYTKKVLMENELILLDDNNKISINKKFCIKGNIKKDARVQKVRIFVDGFKELYEKSKTTEHKKLALLIQLLPYINLRYNIVCDNPSCETVEKIIPLDMKRICDIVGYAYKNSGRLKKELLSIRVNDELVVMFNETDVAKFITINPRVYYKGTKLDDISGLHSLFNVRKV